MGNFGSRKSSLRAIALIQMRNKAEPMNIAKTGKIWKRVGGWNPA